MRAKRRGSPNIIGLLMRAGTVGSDARLRHLRLHVDLLIEPPLERISMLDWKAWAEAIEDGYHHTVNCSKSASSRRSGFSCAVDFGALSDDLSAAV